MGREVVFVVVSLVLVWDESRVRPGEEGWRGCCPVGAGGGGRRRGYCMSQGCQDEPRDG